MRSVPHCARRWRENRRRKIACVPAGRSDFCLSCLLSSGAMLLAIGASFAYLDIEFGAPVLAPIGNRHGRVRQLLLPAGHGCGTASQDRPRHPADLRRGRRRHTARGSVRLALLALPAAGRLGAAPRQLARFALEPAAQRAGTGLGHADGAGRRARALRRNAGAGAAYHRRAGPPVRRSHRERAAACRNQPARKRFAAVPRPSPTARCPWSGRSSSPTVCIAWK